MGQTLKSFQPTIQELSQVSNDLKSTIQNEMGLEEFQRDIDSIRNPMRPTPKPLTQASLDADYPLDPGPATGTVDVAAPDRATSGDSASASAASPPAAGAKAATAAAAEEESEAEFAKKMAESKKMAWGSEYPGELSSDAEPPAPKKKALQDMTMAELEAELEKRKDLIKQLSNDS